MRKILDIKARQVMLFFVGILLLIIIVSVYGVLEEEEPQKEVSVSVIVNDKNNSRWTAFQLGLEQAARDFRADLTIVPTARFESNEDAWNLVTQRVEDKSEGIILTPYSSDGIIDLAEILSGDTMVTLVENDMFADEDTIYHPMSVTPDYKDMSKALITDILEDFNGDLTNKKIYFLTSCPEQAGTLISIEYIKEVLKNQNCLFQSTINTALDKNKRYTKNIQADILIALDDYSLAIAAKELKEKKYNTVSLYGIGLSEQNVYYLEHNIIQSMIVVNEYRMGYESLSLLANSLRNHTSESQNITIDFHKVRPEDVHDPAMEKLLFPNMQ